ncbi:hypothetical protein [Ekhidna sp.]
MAQIIGLGGVSRSEKSTLARRLKEKLEPRQVPSLEMNEYIFDVK